MSAIAFDSWTRSRSTATLSTNAGSSLSLPFQRWRVVKEAFTPELIARAVSESDLTVSHCIDPFGGSGTTGLACQFLGIQNSTIELNPYLADLIESKLCRYEIDKLPSAYGDLIDRVFHSKLPLRPKFSEAPQTFIEPGVEGRFIFSTAIARKILAYRQAINNTEDVAIRRLLRVILGSTLIPMSNVVVSGKGRRYRKNWESRPPSDTDFDDLFKRQLFSAITDINRFDNRPIRDFTLLRGDARELIGHCEPCELAVFSPPYPNSFDYTDVYNVELWALGYLQSSSDNTLLRKKTIRSHVQIKRDMSVQPTTSSTLTKVYKSLEAVRPELWNQTIPEMIRAYFDDLSVVLSKLHDLLYRFGRIYLVVGDSRYAGIDIPTAIILTEIATSLGYVIRSLEPCRAMRSSPQQGGQTELPESLLVLKKP